MSYTNMMNFQDREEYLYYVPSWWYMARGDEIPSDWLNYYGPEEEDIEIMR